MTPPGPLSSRTRTLLLLLAVPLFLVLLMAAGAYWRLEKRVWQVGEKLIADSQAIQAARHPRPSHVDHPTPGTFGQALEPLMPEVRRIYEVERKIPEAVSNRCKEVRNGQRPVAELPRECLASLEQGRPLMRQVLLASRTEEAGLPEGVQALADPSHPDHTSGAVAIQRIVRLAALEVRLEVDGGRADAALELCLDAHAVSRDLAYGNGLLGAMISVFGHKVLFIPCSDALLRASPEALHRATIALRRIRTGLRPLSSAMTEECVLSSLSSFGQVLDPQQVQELPAGARRLVARGAVPLSPVESFFAPVLLRHALIELVDYERQLVSIVDLEPSLRTPRFKALERGVVDSWNPVLTQLSGFNRFAARMDQQRVTVDLLLALALLEEHRAGHGTWPTTLPPLFPDQAVLLPTAMQLQAGDEGAPSLRPEESLLREMEDVIGAAEMKDPPFQVMAVP